MDKVAIIKVVNGFITDFTGFLGEWLSINLPKTGDDWWETKVYENLNDDNREKIEKAGINSLGLFDLATLLYILKRNWYSLAGKRVLSYSDNGYAQRMKNVRNNWAHISIEAVTKDLVKEDMGVIRNMYAALGAPEDKIFELDNFVDDVDLDADVSASPQEILKNAASPETDGEIRLGDMARLKSDPSKKGAVISVEGNRYKLFIDNSVSTFFAEQIEPIPPDTEMNEVSIDRCRIGLTAHQINNPGSSSLYSLDSARIDFIPYQFRPALKMVRADVPRLLIADDVGVGKTIEAGLIIKEMEARGELDSVLIVCPKALVVEHKWLEELKRFDEEFEELNGSIFRDALRMANQDEWPSRHSRIIVPFSLFNEDTVAGIAGGGKYVGIDDLVESGSLPHFSLVIVDEAHNIRNTNTWSYKGVSKFIENADAVIMLTATPIQNTNDDLFTLLHLLRPDIVVDKQTFLTMSEPNVFVNKLRHEVSTQKEGWRDRSKVIIDRIIGTEWGYKVMQNNPSFVHICHYVEDGSGDRESRVTAVSEVEKLHSFDQLFTRTRRCDIESICIRRVEVVRSKYTEEQSRLYDAIISFETSYRTALFGRSNALMMMIMIMRQAASCIYGLAPFLNTMVSNRISELESDGEWYDGNFSFDQNFLDDLRSLAERVRALSENLTGEDPKLKVLMGIIEKKQNEPNRRVIVFSSFRNTLRYIRSKLEEKGYRVGQIDGSVKDDDRFLLRQRFAASTDVQDHIDVLLFSEVGCEGLDYQFCDTMINYDLPWNPMRIEQRIGRIDRRGQNSEHVQIFNMLTEGTIDAAIYDRCLAKIGVFKSSIGDCSEILGDIDRTIIDIMFKPDLTEEERLIKLEKESDNRVLEVLEMRRMEQESKSLYGFDLTDNMVNKEVLDSENKWISPFMVRRLVSGYISDRCGESHISQLKDGTYVLSLTKDMRLMLLEDLKGVKASDNSKTYRDWIKYLKKNSDKIRISFDPDVAKENPKIPFVTHLHPLALQAAKYESSGLPCVIGVSVVDDDLRPGDYPFIVYGWKYTGIRDDVRLVAVCNDEDVRKKVLGFVNEGAEFHTDPSQYEQSWSSLEKTHYSRWQESKKSHVETISAECDYRIEQIRSSADQRIAIFENIMAKVDDPNIRRMRSKQIQNARSEGEYRIENEEKNRKKADIGADLLVKGVLHVTHSS